MKSIKRFLLYFAYVILLFICYNNYVVNTYGYIGFYSNPNSISIFISLFLLILSSFFVVFQKTNSYSKLIIYILFIINYIPTIVLYCYMPQDMYFMFLQTLYWIVAIITVNLLNRKTSIARSDSAKKIIDGQPVYRNSRGGSFLYLAVLAELIVAILVLYHTGINLDFSDVYQLRDNFFTSSVPVLLIYLFSAAKVVNPVIFIFLSKKKKRGWAFLSLLVQLLFFLCDGSKSTIFSFILALIVANIKKKNEDYNYLNDGNFKFLLLGGATIVNFIGLMEFLLVKTSYIYNYFIRRLFFIPAFLHFKYYDFFLHNGYDFFRQSFLGKIGLSSPYPLSIPNMIGLNYFNDSSLVANNGLFSDAFSNLGALGMIIMPILLVLVLKMLDNSVKGIKPLYIVTILISVPYIFLSSSFFTVLLTHGFIILCIIMKFIIPREGSENA